MGVIFDQDIGMDKHIYLVWYVKPPKTILARLRNIGNIRKFLDQGSAETLVHSFVTSKIDYIVMLFFLDLT